MSCYHPLYALPEYNPITNKPYLTKNGKPKLRIFKSDAVPWGNPELITIPCGKCIGCRLDYSRQWANRCMLELGYHDSAYFVTLTYNDGNLPIRYYTDPKTGEAFPVASLVKRDVQLFMKRLRREFSDQHIRFYAAGEYGEESFRPHYHLIIFGLKLDDLMYYGCRNDFTYYTSVKLNKIWDWNCNLSHIDNGFNKSYDVSRCKYSTTPLATRGLVVIGQVSWETCAYVARYVTKKLSGPVASFYKDHNIEPPFSLMSRKPGIGRQYYDDHDCYKYDYINVKTPDGGKKFRPPKYFDKLFDVDYPEQSQLLREQKKKLGNELARAKAAETTESYVDMLSTEESVKTNTIKSLRRSMV